MCFRSGGILVLLRSREYPYKTLLLKTFLRIIAVRKIGGKGPPNEFQYFAKKLIMCLQDFMSPETYTLTDFQKKKQSTPFYGLLKAKKCQKKAFFRKKDVQKSFLAQNDKNFFS